MKISPAYRTLTSILLLIIIGLIDYRANSEIHILLFYLIPIIIFSFRNNIKKIELFAFSTVAALIWGFVDISTVNYSSNSYFLINWVSRYALFLMAAFIHNWYYVEKEQRQMISSQKYLLEKVNTELQNANEQLNKYIGMAAHDIRNPVGSIQMMSELMLEDETISENNRKFLAMIHQSAQNSIQILHDTLNISQIQSGTIQLNLVQEDYIAFIKETITFNEHLAKKKDQKISLLSSLDSMNLLFDKSRLTQVLNNLLTNAIKYSDFNTEIIVKIGVSPESKDKLLTQIIDQGMGIDEEFHQQLFEPFTMTTNIPTNNESKTGLGLAIVKKIIELHNGKIDFTSNKGMGSDFFFTIPIR